MNEIYASFSKFFPVYKKETQLQPSEFGKNEENTLIKINADLNECSYDQKMKEYISNLIYTIMNYKKNKQPYHCIKNTENNKLIVLFYSMCVQFDEKDYNAPLQILIMKNVPYEQLQIYLETAKGCTANLKNEIIIPDTKRIMTPTLLNWNLKTKIDDAMNEIYASF